MLFGGLMNIFKKIYCRSFQGVFNLVLPLMPYREPKILKSNNELTTVLKQKNHKNILLVTDKGIRGLGLTKSLEECLSKNKIKVFVFDDVVPNPTTDNVDAALEIFKSNNCTALVAFGGGSVMDCAKATGARAVKPNTPLSKMKGVLKVGKKLPLLIAIPTTAGTGSETTLAAVITDSKTRHKYAINDFPLIPPYAMLEPSLTVGLPKHITSTTGMDALTHAVEAFIGRSTTKKTRGAAKFAVATIFENIEEVYNNPTNIDARDKMLQASFNAGVAFTRSYVGYVHAIAHSLGGKYNIPHGLANAIILPVVLKKFGKSIHKKLWELAVYAKLCNRTHSFEYGAEVFIEKIEQLNKNMNIPSVIPEIKEEDIAELAKTAEHEANPLYPVPILWTAKDLEKIYYKIKGEK